MEDKKDWLDAATQKIEELSEHLSEGVDGDIFDQDELIQSITNSIFETELSESNELKRLVAQQYNVENWEVEMSNALRNLDAKTVNVEFNYNGKCATEKVGKDTLFRKLVDKDYFSSYYFVNGKSGERLLKNLDVGEYRSHEKGVLECKHIQSITFGRKVIYSALQHV